MIRRPPRSTQSRSSAASDVYKRQAGDDRTVTSVVRVVVLDPAHAEVPARELLSSHGATGDRGGHRCANQGGLVEVVALFGVQTRVNHDGGSAEGADDGLTQSGSTFLT